MEMFSYAGILKKKKVGNRNFYKIESHELLEYLENGRAKDLQEALNLLETIDTIFSAANANSNNKFPLNIKFDHKNIEYKEE